MKVEIKESNQVKERPFPKLMISNSGQLVLFRNFGFGMNVNGVEGNIGHYSNAWVMENFSDFEGSITLSND